MAWLLKTVAIELKTSAVDKRFSHLTHLMRLLFKENTTEEYPESSVLGYRDLISDGEFIYTSIYNKFAIFLKINFK